LDIVRYGLVGLGGWAKSVHIPNIKLVPQAKITALCSRSVENLNAARELVTGEPLLFKDYGELLKSDEVDAVVICAPNFRHAPMAIEALRAGKHVMCEKPIALSVEECDRVLNAWRESGRLLWVGFELRSSPLLRKARDLVRDGAVGDAALVWGRLFRRPLSKKEWRLKQELFGGIFLELGCHYIDAFDFLLDASPIRVSASGRKWRAEAYVDCSWVTLDYANGAAGTFGMCLFEHCPLEMALNVVGTSGRLEIDIDAVKLRLHDPSRTKPTEFDFSPPADRPIHGFTGSFEEHRDFVQAILAGKTYSDTVDAAARSVRTCLAIEESMAKNAPVEL